MHCLFISDLHLDQSRPDITGAFLSFLDEYASKAEQLYILGDFFDTWIGDDYLSFSGRLPYIDSILHRIQVLRAGGTSVYFMHGNRDFLLGDLFMERCGATLLVEPTVIDLDGIPTLLMHGDSLCIDDHSYMQFRKMARSQSWIDSQLAKPIEERIAFAQQLRKTSVNKNQQTAENILDVNKDEVVRVMEQFDAYQLIHGHTHRPAIHNISSDQNQTVRYKKRFVLGDWDNKGWYLSYKNKEFTLETLPLPKL